MKGACISRTIRFLLPDVRYTNYVSINERLIILRMRDKCQEKVTLALCAHQRSA
jgi:hypothetical protein